MNAARLAAARAAPALRRPARSFTVLETMARPVANMPNKIAEYRTPYVQNLHLHGADNPTYLKGDGDKTQVAVGFALLGFALLQVTRGLWRVMNGVGRILRRGEAPPCFIPGLSCRPGERRCVRVLGGVPCGAACEAPLAGASRNRGLPQRARGSSWNDSPARRASSAAKALSSVEARGSSSSKDKMEGGVRIREGARTPSPATVAAAAAAADKAAADELQRINNSANACERRAQRAWRARWRAARPRHEREGSGLPRALRRVEAE